MEAQQNAGNDDGNTTVNNLNVLYVEDDEFIRYLFVPFLNRHASKVSVANDGAEGWQLYQTTKPDVVVTDILMPVMNGMEMARLIKAADRACPIVFITATPESAQGFEPFDSRIDRVLEKPVQLAELAKILKSYVAVAREAAPLTDSRKRQIDDGA